MHFSLFLISLVFLVVNMVSLLFSVMKSPVTIDFSNGSLIKSLFFSYQPVVVIISLFFMNVYVVGTSRAMTNAFAKTQCSEVSFFFCFLVACLSECSRFYIPILATENPFSEAIVFLGRFSIFARMLAPLSLLSCVILTSQDQRQNEERNMLLIVVVSMVIAIFLPLNTGIIEKDFRIHAGFDRIVVAIEILVDTLAVLSLAALNLREGQSQKSAVGMAMVIAGFVLSINSYNFLVLVLSMVFFIVGTVFYLKEIHDRNLYS